MDHPLSAVLIDQDRTVGWLARKCDLSPSYVWRMLHGERPLTEEFKAAASEALNVPVSELFFAEDMPAEAAS